MLRALEPLYNRVFEIIEKEFLTKRGIITTLEKGLPVYDVQSVDETLYPWVFLDWGNIGEVHTVTSPNNFVRYPYNASYQFNLPLVIMTFADAAQKNRLIFSGNTEDADNQNLGIGDLVQQISDHLFQNYRAGFFSSPPSEEWIVPTWTIAGVQTPSSAHVTALLVLNNYIRAAQLNIRFTVAETTN